MLQDSVYGSEDDETDKPQFNTISTFQTPVNIFGGAELNDVVKDVLKNSESLPVLSESTKNQFSDYMPLNLSTIPDLTLNPKPFVSEVSKSHVDITPIIPPIIPKKERPKEMSRTTGRKRAAITRPEFSLPETKDAGIMHTNEVQIPNPKSLSSKILPSYTSSPKIVQNHPSSPKIAPSYASSPKIVPSYASSPKIVQTHMSESNVWTQFKNTSQEVSQIEELVEKNFALAMQAVSQMSSTVPTCKRQKYIDELKHTIELKKSLVYKDVDKATRSIMKANIKAHELLLFECNTPSKWICCKQFGFSHLFGIIFTSVMLWASLWFYLNSYCLFQYE